MLEVEFDDLLQLIGGTSPYQWFLVIFVQFAAIFQCFNTFNIIFIGGLPDYWCWYNNTDFDHFNATEDDIRQIIAPYRSSSRETGLSQCEMYVRNYTDITRDEFLSMKSPNTTTNLTRTACTQWHYSRDVFEKTIVSDWNIVCDQHWQLVLNKSLYMAGYIVGCLFFGQLTDRIGRKKGLILSVIGQFIGSVGMIFAPEMITFTALRFIVAIFTIGGFTQTFVYSIELITSKWRVQAGAIGSTFWSCGIMLYALLAYFIRDWRLLQIALTAGQIHAFSYFWVLPESPRWLYVQGREKEANEIMAKFAKSNKRKLPDQFKIIFKEGSATGSMMDMVRTPKLRKRSLVLFYAWFTVSLLYYGLTNNAGKFPGDAYFNMMMSGVSELPSRLAMVTIMPIIGRKIPVVGSFTIAGLLLIAIAFVPAEIDWLQTVLAMTAKFFIAIIFTSVYLYSGELMPTVIRNLAVSTCSMFARISATMEPAITYIGEMVPQLPPILFGSLAIIGGLLCLMLPETNKKPLPETIEEAENYRKHFADKGISRVSTAEVDFVDREVGQRNRDDISLDNAVAATEADDEKDFEADSNGAAVKSDSENAAKREDPPSYESVATGNL